MKPRIIYYLAHYNDCDPSAIYEFKIVYENDDNFCIETLNNTFIELSKTYDFNPEHGDYIKKGTGWSDNSHYFSFDKKKLIAGAKKNIRLREEKRIADLENSIINAKKALDEYRNKWKESK